MLSLIIPSILFASVLSGTCERTGKAPFCSLSNSAAICSGNGGTYAVSSASGTGCISGKRYLCCYDDDDDDCEFTGRKPFCNTGNAYQQCISKGKTVCGWESCTSGFQAICCENCPNSAKTPGISILDENGKPVDGLMPEGVDDNKYIPGSNTNDFLIESIYLTEITVGLIALCNIFLCYYVVFKRRGSAGFKYSSTKCIDSDMEIGDEQQQLKV